MYKFYGTIIYYLLRLIKSTLKLEIIGGEKIDKNKSYVVGLWHNKVVATALGLDFIDKKAGLASPSHDGELISTPLEKLGFKMVRGSSGRDSVKGLLKLVKLMKEGYTVGTPLDGPKGPRFKAKQGMMYLAQKADVPLVVVGIGYSKKWVFDKTWDKCQLPKPFSKIICVVGEPIIIPKDADLKDYQKLVEEKLNEVNKEAEELASH